MIDNDCDGGIDNADLDNDLFISVECNGTDCDDNSDSTYPGAAYVEDLLGNFCMQDADGDGYGSREPNVPDVDAGTDCDDENPLISPSATEICDETDNNCNDEVDEGVSNTYYIDEDEDNYGECEGES